MCAEPIETTEEERQGAVPPPGMAIRAVLCAIAAVPFVFLVALLFRFGLAFPYWDAWHFAPLLDHAESGRLSFAELWSQHNEHRPLFPRLLMLVMARASGWNVGLELGLSVLLVLCGGLILAWLALRQTENRRPAVWLSLPVLSLLLFSWAQMENWVWGWQLQIFLSTVCVVATISLLSPSADKPLRLVLAMVFATIASFSFASGLLVWIAAIPVLLLAPAQSQQRRLLCTGFWIAVAVVVIQAYFIGYHSPSVSPSLAASARDPITMVRATILHLGSPIAAMFTRPPWHGGPPLGVSSAHYVPGVVGLLWAGGLFLLWRRRQIETAWAAPWIGLGLFSLGCAAITALGRAGQGVEEALNSRYITSSNLFWVALLGLTTLAFDSTALLSRRRWERILVVLLGIVLICWQTQTNNMEWERNAHRKQLGWQALRAGHEAPLYLQDLCWDPVELRDVYLPLMKRHGYAGMGTDIEDPQGLAGTFAREAKVLLSLGLRRQSATYTETALRLDPDNKLALELVDTLRERVREEQGQPGSL